MNMTDVQLLVTEVPQTRRTRKANRSLPPVSANVNDGRHVIAGDCGHTGEWTCCVRRNGSVMYRPLRLAIWGDFLVAEQHGKVGKDEQR